MLGYGRLGSFLHPAIGVALLAVLLIFCEAHRASPRRFARPRPVPMGHDGHRRWSFCRCLARERWKSQLLDMQDLPRVENIPLDGLRSAAPFASVRWFLGGFGLTTFGGYMGHEPWVAHDLGQRVLFDQPVTSGGCYLTMFDLT